jgi:hypothetical protein
MLLIVLAFFWVAVLVPVGIRHFRDSGTERSIDSFHAEHEVLSRQEYTVPPAHRLDRADEDGAPSAENAARPRLTVVHADDTYRSLETRSSWDEWSQDYDYDRDANARRREEAKNRYAAAYSSVPSEPVLSRYEDSHRPRVSMKVRRTRVFLGLCAAALVFSAGVFVVGSSIIQDLAIVSWLGVVGFVAAALFAVSQGYLHESSLPLRRNAPRGLATIEPLRPDDGGFHESEFYDPEAEAEWRRESASHYALG